MMDVRSLFNRGLMAAALCAVVSIGVPSSEAAAQDTGATVTPVFAGPLPNAPGQSLTAALVSYAPGARSGSHRHAGSVLVYVLTGAIRSEVSTDGPAKVFKAGETFFEPPGSRHLVSENASDSEPASLLAIFVAETGAKLTIFDE
jgi:quercetin dioxygenase-like cupin family protein